LKIYVSHFKKENYLIRGIFEQMLKKMKSSFASLLVIVLLSASFTVFPLQTFAEANVPTITLPTEGLLAWYKLDDAEGSTKAKDSSGNGHDSVTAIGTWLPAGGVDGGAFAFNGSSDMIQLNSTSVSFLRNAFTAHTAALWFKVNSTQTTQVLYERGGNVAGLAIRINNNHLEAAVVNGGTRYVLSQQFIDTTSWHHVTVSFNYGDFRLYLDGQLVQETSTNKDFTQVASALNEAAVGARYGVDAFGGSTTGSWFGGMMDDVRLYSTAVEPTAVQVDTKGVSLSDTSLTMPIGDTHTLVASVEPVYATNKEVTWKSSNEAVAKVTTDGAIASVEAIGAGTATITAVTYGDYTASCDITVQAVPVDGVSLNPPNVILTKNSRYTFIPTITPSYATNRNVSWKSDKPSVATIDQSGMVTAIGPGIANITVTTEDGGHSATSEVRVNETLGDGKAYLMSYFRSDVGQTGQKDQDLFLAYSRDGVQFYELNDNQTVLGDVYVIRDPFLAQGQDGIWRLVFTTNGPINDLGYAESKDLIHWSNLQKLDVMKAFKDQGNQVFNSWAPEWVYDPVNEEYVLFWSSTLGTAANNNKHYYTITKDWKTFSDAQLLFDPGTSAIDADMIPVRADDVIDGQRVRDKLGIDASTEIPGNIVWFMFFKDETPESKGGMRNRQTWSIAGPTGTDSFESHISDYVSPFKTEGPTVFKFGDEWHFIYDYWWAGKFGLKTTTDITAPGAWSDEVTDFRIPYRARHAGVTEINDSLLWNVINNYSLNAYYPFNGNASDESGNLHNGTLIGSPTITPLDGKNAGYVRFDGKSDAIELNHLKDSFYNRSVSLWVKANDTERSQMLYDEGDKDGGLALKIENNKLIAGISKKDATTSPLQSISSDFTDTNWHLVVVVYEEGVIKLYVDGQIKNSMDTGYQPKQSTLNQDGSDPQSRNPELYDIEMTNSTAELGMGTENDVFGEASGDHFYNGKMGQVQVYTVPLFDKDVAELYNSSKDSYDDNTAPVTTDNAPESWTNQDTTVSLNAVDSGSGVLATYYTVDGGDQQTGATVTITTEGTHTIAYWSEDKAGNLETRHTVSFGIDRSAPVTTAVVTPSQPDGQNGWYVHSVTVTLTADDNLSGAIKTEYSLDGGSTWQSYTVPLILSQDSKQYTLEYRSTDNAGNEEAAKMITFKLDATAPTITVSGVVYGSYSDSVDIEPVIVLGDNLSGVDNSKTTITLDTHGVQPGATIPLYTLPLGLHTFIVSACDQAGNVSSHSIMFQTSTSIQSLQDLITHFTSAGWIDNAGIANSLQSKLAATNLTAFVNEVQAQSGKHIPAQYANDLIRDAQYLLSKK
jgi:uncharacterized protein YjdB